MLDACDDPNTDLAAWYWIKANNCVIEKVIFCGHLLRSSHCSKMLRARGEAQVPLRATVPWQDEQLESYNGHVR